MTIDAIEPKWQATTRYDAEMTDLGTEDGIGARIKTARRARGFGSIGALAAAIPGGEPTTAILANIESGRKVDINIVHILNIAMALKVPVSYLLAPLTRPNSSLDLPGLSDAFANMTAAEFDAWLAAVPDGDYRADTAAERNDLAELHALRELQTLRRELRRLRVATTVHEETSPDSQLVEHSKERIGDVEERITTIESYLGSAGWDLDPAETKG